MDRNSDLIRYFKDRADALCPSLAWQASSPAEHRTWRRRMLLRFKPLLGRTPRPVPLQVQWDETLETEHFTRRKVYVRTEADYWAPAYYFIPRRLARKAPAILCFHGHSGIFPYIAEGTEAERKKCAELELDYALHFARNGYISLAVVQRGWNETGAGCHQLTMNAFLTGATPIGMRVWDAMRFVDFLRAQPEVDRTRIGAAGLSGGGTTTLYFAALDPRVKLAMVAGCFCTYRASLYEISHCICNCIPGVMQIAEMSDVAALIAPRPLLVISGKRDSIFPISATRAASWKLAKTYAVLGADGNFGKDFFDGPHAWSNRKTLPFLQKHFGHPG